MLIFRSPSGTEIQAVPMPEASRDFPELTESPVSFPKETTQVPVNPDHMPEPINDPILYDHNNDFTTETDETDEPSSGMTDDEDPVRRARVSETRHNILSRNDNIVVFINERGEPCDAGSRLLQQHDKLPTLADGVVGRAKVVKRKGKYIIALVVQDRISTLTQVNTLKETIAFLYDVTRELGLRSVSLSSSCVGDVPWRMVRGFLIRGFSDSPTRLIICSNEIITPPTQDRIKIIEENHATAIGGHKGVTKTLHRIRYKYQWPRMKEDVLAYIRECRECQLKKLVRLKTRQPMVLTDTRCSATDRVCMDADGSETY